MTTHYPPPQAPYVPPQPPPRKRHPVRKWLLIASAVFAGGLAVIIALVLALGAALSSGEKHAASKPSARSSAIPMDTSPQQPPSAQAGPDQLAIGATESVTDGSGIDATLTATSARVTTKAADLEFGEPPAHGYYVIIHIKAVNLASASGSYDINPMDFYVKIHGRHYDEGDGNAFEAVADPSSAELSYTTLNPGESTSGVLLFDVPSPHGTLMYAPNYQGGAIVAWQY